MCDHHIIDPYNANDKLNLKPFIKGETCCLVVIEKSAVFLCFCHFLIHVLFFSVSDEFVILSLQRSIHSKLVAHLHPQ